MEVGRWAVVLMPSHKIKSAVAGRAINRSRPSPAKSKVRLSAAPTTPEEARAQEDIRAAFGSMFKNTPFSNGKLISGFLDTNGGEIDHGLGGEAAGFIVCNMQVRANPPAAVPSVWRVTGSPDRAMTHIHLFASEPVDITIWVYR